MEEKKQVQISDVVYPELFSTQKLSFSSDNFLIWKLKLSFLLADRNLHHLLHPSPPSDLIPPPNESFIIDPTVMILRTLDDNYRMEFGRYPTAESILARIFSRLNSLLKGYRIIWLRNYIDLRMESGAHINQHIFRMRAMAKKLEYAGVKLSDEVQASMLINSLPEEWQDDVDGLLRDMDLRNEEEFSWDKVCRRLRNLGDVRKWREFKRGEEKFEGSCYCCGKQGHLQSDCPDPDASRRKGLDSTILLFSTGASFLEILYSALNGSLKYNPSYYASWRSDLFDVLKESKVDYVLKDPIPVEFTNVPSDADPESLKKWRVDDLTCRHLILGTMEDDLFLSFHDYPTAKAILEAVDGCFNYSSPARKLHLLQKYLDHHMVEDTPIIDHIGKMDTMVGKLRMSGLNIPEEMQSVMLLESLPNTWQNILEPVKMHIRIKDDYSINHMRRKVTEMGHVRELLALQCASGTSHDRANNKRKRGQRGNCFSCGRPGHFRADCPDR